MKKYFSSLLIVLLTLGVQFPIHAAFPIKEQSTVVRLDIGAHRSVDTSKVSSTREIVHFREKNKHTHQKSTAIYLAIISILLGGLGLHRFYLGYIVEGIFELLGLASFIAGVSVFAIALLGGPFGFFLLGLLLMLLGFGSWLIQIGDLVTICTDELTPRKRQFSKPVMAKKQRLGWDNN